MSYPWGEQIFEHTNPIGLSYSSEGTWESCRRKFEFMKFYPRTEREDNFDGEVGKAMHNAFQTWLIGGCTWEARDAAYVALCKSYPVLMSEGSDPEGVKSVEQCYGLLEDVFNKGGILLEYEIATIQHLDGSIRPAIEVEFEIWIDGLYCDGRPFVYRGFIDAILFNKFTGEYCVVDLKTTKNKRKHIQAEYKFNGQCVAYGLVLQAILQRDLFAFTVRYVHCVFDWFDPDCQIAKFDKDESDVKDWATSLYLQIKEIIDCWDRDYFPRTQQGCAHFNKPCEFLNICGSRDRQQIYGYITANMKVEDKPQKYNPWVRLILPLGDAA